MWKSMTYHLKEIQSHCWVCNPRCSHLGVTRLRISLWCTQTNKQASKRTSIKIHVNFHSFSHVLCSTHVSGNNSYKISKPENHTIILWKHHIKNWQWITFLGTITDRNILNTGLCKYFVQRFQNELYKTSLGRTMWWFFCEFAPETIKAKRYGTIKEMELPI
jgi:hypothetical protein